MENGAPYTDHAHTSLPALDSPWCAICDALLTHAIIYADWVREEDVKLMGTNDEERD